MITKIEINRILKLMRDSVSPTVGGAEPLAISLAVAKARELLGDTPDKVVVRLSPRIVKNSAGVPVGGIRGMIGIPSAIALGAVAGKAEKGLDCLEDLTEEDLEKARKFIEERRYAMRPAHTFEIIYIEIEASLGEHEARVLIAKESTHFVYLKTDNKVLLDERYTLAKTYDRCHESDLNMQLIWDFVTAVPLEQIQFLLDGAHENQKVAEMAFAGDYGLNLGKMLKGSFEERIVGQNIMPRLVSYTCAACDVRMSGNRIPVFSICGSGNQGIAGTLPVLMFSEGSCCSNAKLMRALALSTLVIIYIKQLLGQMSSHCGCVVASTGSACALAYLVGGGYEEVCAAAKNQIASLVGVMCDGAKPSCTLKLSTGVSSALQSAMMAKEGICVSSTDGIIEDSVDRSIDNLANIGRDAMLENDSMLLRIMTEKEETENAQTK
jgi:L-cysteine desulfidase